MPPPASRAASPEAATPDTGPAPIAAAMLTAPAITATLDLPSELGMTAPAPRAGRRGRPAADAMPPARRAYSALVARIGGLQAQLLSAARTAADRAVLAASHRASVMQGDLNHELSRLSLTLQHARTGLTLLADRQARRLDSLGMEATAAIRAAAGRALGELAAAKARLSQERDTLRTQTWAAPYDLVGTQAANIRQSADAAIAAMDQVPTLATATYTGAGSDLAAAQAEEKRLRLPARVDNEKLEIAAARDYDAHKIEEKTARLDHARDEAMRPLDARVTALSGLAPRAIQHAQDAAIGQLHRQLAQLRQGLATGRVAADLALVRQHRAARAQMIATARSRLEAAQHEARSRLAGEAAAAAGMAAGLAAAGRSLRTNLAGQAEHPADQFAAIVVAASAGLQQQLETSAPERCGQILRASEDGQASQAASLAAGRSGFAAGADAAVAALTEAAEQAGSQLAAQIAAAEPGLLALAPPVARSIDGFVQPLATACAAAIVAMKAGVTKLQASLVSEYENGMPTATGNSPPGADEAAPPKEAGPTPGGFVGRMTAVKPAPLQWHSFVDLAAQVDSAVQTDVQTRASTLKNTLDASDVAATFAQLRGLTRTRALAIETQYRTDTTDALRDDIRSGLTKVLSSDETNEGNIAAALAYLDGNAAEGARLEMQVAIYLWNDNERVKLVARSLTREQMAQLAGSEDGRATLDDVQGDLNDATGAVFAALRAGDTDRAAAIELQQHLDEAREKNGQAGADRTADLIVAAQAAPRDALSGADPLLLGLDADRAKVAPEQYPQQVQREHWQRTQAAFAGLPGVAPGSDPAAALVAYATRSREYVVENYDTTNYGGDGGPSYDVVTEGITGPNRDLIDDLVRHGEGSAEARASRLAVEAQRAGGPDATRLATATYDARLNTALMLDPHDPQAAEHAEQARQKALELRAATYQSFAARYGGDLSGNPQAAREVLATQLQANAAADPARGAYAAAMVRSDDPETVALAGLRYAVSGEDVHTDVLQHVAQSLRRNQLDHVVAQFDADALAHGQPGLVDRLGIYDRTVGNLSGDDRQKAQEWLLGAQVTDGERFEAAALKARQQQQSTGALGHVMNDLGGAGGRLDRNQAKLYGLGDVTDDDFEPSGRLRIRDPATGGTAGRFEANGNFIPTSTASLDNLNAAMIGTRLAAEGYSAATDRIARGIVTGLMVVAAVVTTALTAGAAGGFWVAALIATSVTLTAGVAGIGLTYALKGDRYTAHEALHDLEVVGVQAVTAGIGAGLGAVMKAAALASKAAAPLWQEIAVGGITNALGSAGQAAIEHRPVGAAFLRGLAGGSLGAAAARPFGALLGADAGQFERAIVRSATSATSGAVSRAGEIAIDTATGEDRRSLGEQIDDVKQAAAQNAIQGALEQGGEHLGEAHHDAAVRRAAGPEAGEAAGPRPAGDASPPPAGGPAARAPAERPPARQSATEADARPVSVAQDQAAARVQERAQQLARRADLSEAAAHALQVLPESGLQELQAAQARGGEVTPEGRARLIATAVDATQGVDPRTVGAAIDALAPLPEPTAPAAPAADRQRAARDILSQELDVTARTALHGQPMEALAALPETALRRAAGMIGRGQLDPAEARALLEAARTATSTLDEPGFLDALAAAVETGRAARQRAAVLAAAPEAARAMLGVLPEPAMSQLHAALLAGSSATPAQHEALLGTMLQVLPQADPAVLAAALDAISGHARAQAETARAGRREERLARLGDLPPALADPLSALPDHALLALQAAQAQGETLTPARRDALVADGLRETPAADPRALRAAVDAFAEQPAAAATADTARLRAELAAAVPAEQRHLLDDVAVLVMNDAAFARFSRSGRGEAVTLIIDGRPVVVVRRGADPTVLQEEGIHAVQARAPATAAAAGRLDERTLAEWDRLPVEQQMELYRAKLDLEVDAQQRLIGSLEDRARGAAPEETAAFAGQRRLAAEALANLQRRQQEVAAVSGLREIEIGAGLAERPDWLDQPARLFAKKSPLDEERAAAALVQIDDPAQRARVKAMVSRLEPAEQTEALSGLERLAATPETDAVRQLKAFAFAADRKDLLFERLRAGRLALELMPEAAQDNLLALVSATGKSQGRRFEAGAILEQLRGTLAPSETKLPPAIADLAVIALRFTNTTEAENMVARIADLVAAATHGVPPELIQSIAGATSLHAARDGGQPGEYIGKLTRLALQVALKPGEGGILLTALREYVQVANETNPRSISRPPGTPAREIDPAQLRDSLQTLGSRAGALSEADQQAILQLRRLSRYDFEQRAEKAGLELQALRAKQVAGTLDASETQRLAFVDAVNALRPRQGNPAEQASWEADPLLVAPYAPAVEQLQAALTLLRAQAVAADPGSVQFGRHELGAEGALLAHLVSSFHGDGERGESFFDGFRQRLRQAQSDYILDRSDDAARLRALAGVIGAGNLAKGQLFELLPHLALGGDFTRRVSDGEFVKALGPDKAHQVKVLLQSYDASDAPTRLDSSPSRRADGAFTYLGGDAAAPLEAQQTYLYDTKAGKGAFDPEQFVRYVREQVSRDGSGPQALGSPAGLVYIADSRANAEHAQGEARRLVTKINQTGSISLDGRLDTLAPGALDGLPIYFAYFNPSGGLAWVPQNLGLPPAAGSGGPATR